MLVSERVLFDDGQRHRAHRIAVDPRARHPQGLFPARHRHRRRHRADHRAEQLDPAHRAARHHAAQHHPVQRLERAGGAGHAQQQDAARAADLRLRPQLPAHPAVHHPGPVDPGALRRQAAPDHRRRRPGQAQLQGAVADGRGQRAADHQRDRAGRHRAHRRARVQRQAELEPAGGRPVPGAAGRRARRPRGAARRRRQGQRQLSRRSRTSCASTASARAT